MLCDRYSETEIARLGQRERETLCVYFDVGSVLNMSSFSFPFVIRVIFSFFFSFTVRRRSIPFLSTACPS